MQCHTLAYAEELEALSFKARRLESNGELRETRDTWAKALELLPADSTQRDWVQEKVRKLDLLLQSAPPPEQKHKWARKFGPFAPLLIALAKAKWLFSLFKLKFLFSLFAFLGFYWAIWGWKFGVGFAVLILLHEMGHYIDVTRRGLPAEMPVFLPGFGAYVKWEAMGVSKQTRAAVSLAGPLAGWLSAAICAALWWKSGNAIWGALARAGAWLNVLNLIPVWILDGGQAVAALDKMERSVLVAVSLILWLSLNESTFFLVAAGATWRLFTKDFPLQSSRSTTVYFVFLLAALGLIMRLFSNVGFGGPS